MEEEVNGERLRVKGESDLPGCLTAPGLGVE
jgi:hypothetical protein